MTADSVGEQSAVAAARLASTASIRDISSVIASLLFLTARLV